MTQLYQSETLIGATLLSLLPPPSLSFSPSLSLIHPPALRATWTGGVCAPLSTVQYVQSQEGVALMVAGEDPTWAQQAESRLNEKPLEAF